MEISRTDLYLLKQLLEYKKEIDMHESLMAKNRKDFMELLCSIPDSITPSLIGLVLSNSDGSGVREILRENYIHVKEGN